jgi:2-dehydro-3-deoxyphosphogluconate aldolase / (4S)-4-hydroxy-2-oxoglutarate aldolase
MNKPEVCELICEVGVVPAIRVSSAEDAHFAADAVISGGIPIMEITMTVPGAIDVISHLVHFHKKMVVGAGTVLDTETARRCLDAGACFLTAPGFDPAIMEFAAKENIPILPGALTPTEVIMAWKAGADFVKVFPCSEMGEERYIKRLKRSLPQVSLIAAGGVTQHKAGSYILAGAAAIGVGIELIPPEAIQRREAERIRELAHRFVGFVKEARELMRPEKESDSVAKADFRNVHRHRPQ